MIVSKEYKHEYVCCLPKELEQTVMNEVKKEINFLHLTNNEKQEAIENANNSKLCDLTDTIEIKFI